MKQKRSLLRMLAATALRKTGLIQAADWLVYLAVRARKSSTNKAFCQQNPDFPTPPPHLAYDAFGTVNWPRYLDIGSRTAAKLGDLVAKYLQRPLTDYLEWGCGPGAVIRHMPDVLGKDAKISATDYNGESIAWCTQALKRISFAHNNIAPPLAFAPSSFDCVAGLSVLTHLSDEMCRAWVQELARVTRVGGLVILTTKGDSHEYRLLPSELQSMKEGRGVFKDEAQEGKRMYDSILPTRYVETILPPTLEVLFHGADAMPDYGQDLWVLRKKSDNSPETSASAAPNRGA